MLALYVLGVAIDLREGLIIESLGQALRAVGFAVPGSLGVQEGGYILVCGLLGVGPQAAIELSFLKRIREVALGIPGLIGWQIIEGRQLASRILSTGTKRASFELTKADIRTPGKAGSVAVRCQVRLIGGGLERATRADAARLWGHTTSDATRSSRWV